MSPLTSAIYYEIDTTVPLKCFFSCNHPNRIMVEKQGIEKIIHSEPDNIQILIEEKANQAFILVREELREPVTLCVITSDGEVQDLEVTFRNQPSELVILRQKSFVEIEKTPAKGFEDCQMQTIINLLLANQPLPGFCETNFCSGSTWLQKKVKISEIKRFEKENELICVFKVSNCAKRRYDIYEKDFAYENSTWVFLEKNSLLSGESVLAIISFKKDIR